jgi:hypothetical protein
MSTFAQTKLTKLEWESMEQALDSSELRVLSMIRRGFHDPTIHEFVQGQTLNNLFKLDCPDKDYHLYMTLLKDIVDRFVSKHKLAPLDLSKVKPKKPLSKADQIRLKASSETKLESSVEYVVLENLRSYVKEKRDHELYYYNIQHLLQTYPLNKLLVVFVKQFLVTQKVSSIEFLRNTSRYMENNPVFNYKPMTLYKHQADVYEIMKADVSVPRLVFYRAPTCSGKTLTPIGLCEQYRVIFICASRHIGLSLAKSAVNAGRKVGFAFGCQTADDVRLHFSAVNTYITTRSGHKKPNHEDGRNVELMICDVRSYEVAMLYMGVFTPPEKTILYWDEPTITMDYAHHELHDHIRHIWTVNKVPHVILSSATLPNESQLQPIIDRYQAKHPTGKVHYVETLDETTNVTLVDTKGEVIMPHTVFKEDLEGCKAFIEQHGRSHMKFLSLTECANFCLHANPETVVLAEFPDLPSITSQKLRLFYYDTIMQRTSQWTSTVNAYLARPEKSPALNVGNEILTRSAHTLTYGPTIYLCEDPSRWTQFFLDNAGLPPDTYQDLEAKIQFNNDVAEKMSVQRKLVEDKLAKDEGHENKLKEQRFDPATKALMANLEKLEKALKNIQLPEVLHPNTREHFSKWAPKQLDYETANAFLSLVAEEDVRRIMALNDVGVQLKMLLLMGVGVFTPESSDYSDVMKELAEAKRLGVIVAGSDYIYGTNYQFSHAYVAEDLQQMTQEKIVQAIGRVGRKEKNKTFTFRFRDDTIIRSLYVQSSNCEAANMNALFL